MNLDVVTMTAEIERLKAENSALKSSPAKALSFKVSTKGAVSVYGLGRFPVTLYKQQWERLIAAISGPTGLETFLGENESLLKVKE